MTNKIFYIPLKPRKNFCVNYDNSLLFPHLYVSNNKIANSKVLDAEK